MENRCEACGSVRPTRDAADACPACGKSGEARVVFPGVIEAERRVDYLYQALARLASVGGVGGKETLPGRTPKDLIPFARVASEGHPRVSAALDDDLNTPVALAVLSELAKAANELADLVQKRKKDVDLQRSAPFVAAQVDMAMRSALAPLGLLQTPLAAYRERTQRQRLALLGLSPREIDARLAERAAAREAKDFARGDALRTELEAQGIEVADGPEGTTWRVAPGGRMAAMEGRP
jgi:cysteinyl-tRNA synthetase